MSISPDRLTLSFDVSGIPVQQGNHRRNAYGATYETSKNHAPWRDSVVWAAREAKRDLIGRDDDSLILLGPVMVSMQLTFPRPKSHYRTGKNAHVLRDDAHFYKSTAPDADKLARSILDALAIAGVYRSDAQVAALTVVKGFGQEPGAHVEVTRL